MTLLKAIHADTTWEVWLEPLRRGDTTQPRNRKGQLRRPGLPESGRRVVIASTHPEGALAVERRITLVQFHYTYGVKTIGITVTWEACKKCQPLGPIPELWGQGPGFYQMIPGLTQVWEPTQNMPSRRDRSDTAKTPEHFVIKYWGTFNWCLLLGFRLNHLRWAKGRGQICNRS